LELHTPPLKCSCLVLNAWSYTPLPSSVLALVLNAWSYTPLPSSVLVLVLNAWSYTPLPSSVLKTWFLIKHKNYLIQSRYTLTRKHRAPVHPGQVSCPR
jgi:hypothetical protein